MKPINWRSVLKLAGICSVVAFVVTSIGVGILFSFLVNTITPEGVTAPPSSSPGDVQAILAPLAAVVAFVGVIVMAVNAALED